MNIQLPVPSRGDLQSDEGSQMIRDPSSTYESHRDDTGFVDPQDLRVIRFNGGMQKRYDGLIDDHVLWTEWF